MSYATVPPHMNQIELHPWNQRKAQLESCNKHGIAVEGWGPFAKGHILKDETLEAIASTYKKNIAQLCVRWALQRNFITIPKSISKERILSNVDVFDFEISNEDMEKINSMDKGYLSGSEHWEHDKIE
jgi:diketogulonate reductase-like aldo/keto reductase